MKHSNLYLGLVLVEPVQVLHSSLATNFRLGGKYVCSFPTEKLQL
jgi:hypothetical protein